jgi:hypothetical protein
MDADALKDEQRGSGRRSRVVLTPRRRRQVSRKYPLDDGDKKSPITGESSKETVKTIARGMPGVSGVTVVTNSRVFFYTRGCGRTSRPAFPAPSIFWGETALTPRALCVAGSRRHVELAV